MEISDRQSFVVVVVVVVVVVGVLIKKTDLFLI